jgi:hypothetical protein
MNAIYSQILLPKHDSWLLATAEVKELNEMGWNHGGYTRIRKQDTLWSDSSIPAYPL